MKKVLLTGATGFIGYYLINELYKHSVEFWAICRKESKDLDMIKAIPGAHLIICDLNHINDIPNLCEEREFDAFFHLAWDGASGIRRGIADLQIDNIKWTMDCVELASKMRCKKIIITGTVCENQVEAINAEGSFLGSSFYLMAKKYSHSMAKNMGRKLKQNILWCNFYHPIGIYNKKEQIIANTIYKLIKNERLEYGKGQALFDVIDVTDLAYALYLMGTRDLKSDTYYIGSGKPKILKEYIEIVRDIVQPDAQLDFGGLDLIDLPMDYEWLDVSKFNKETGFKPQVDFEQSIYKMKEWLLDMQKYEYLKWNFIEWK